MSNGIGRKERRGDNLGRGKTSGLGGVREEGEGSQGGKYLTRDQGGGEGGRNHSRGERSLGGGCKCSTLENERRGDGARLKEG